MTSQELVAQLINLENLDAQKELLNEHMRLLEDKLFADEIADGLKTEANNFLGSNIQSASNLAKLLLYLSVQTGNSLHRALGLRAKANVVFMGDADYQSTVELCDEAMHIYETQNMPTDAAMAQTIKIPALARLGNFDEAFEVGEQISQILRKNELWVPLVGVISNIAAIHHRRGEDSQALALFDQIKELYTLLGEVSESNAKVDHNRGVFLRNLGKFEESIELTNAAWSAFNNLGVDVGAARAQQSMANTHFVLGRYNEALKLLEQVREVFWADQRPRDALLTDLYICECLLQLHRFHDVLDKCRQVRKMFTEQGNRWEIAQAIWHEATAHTGLKNYAEAMQLLIEARTLFEKEGNYTWVNISNLEIAIVLYNQKIFDESLATALTCSEAFQNSGQLLREAHAYLVATESYIALGDLTEAQSLLEKAISIGQAGDIPYILFQGYYLQGQLAEHAQNLEIALDFYDQSIKEIERLRRNLMVEYRVDFQAEKQVVYEDAVRLSLLLDQPLRSLEYAERIKSRTLIDLLAYRFSLNIQAREQEDSAVITRLNELQNERDRLYRRWETREDHRSAPNSTSQEARQTVLNLEKEITELRNRLLIQNADYAQDISLQQVHAEPIQPHIPNDTLLVEYFVVGKDFFVFLVTSNTIEVHTLPGTLSKVQKLIRRLQLNFKSVPQQQSNRAIVSLQNAQYLLKQLYDILIAPIQSAFKPEGRLLIVPYGSLHYLPFHALYDGQQFLIEQYEISYVPGSSLLRYQREPSEKQTKMAAFGYSREGELAHTVNEVKAIVRYLDADTYLEENATLEQLYTSANQCRALHLATHGDFRPDNPLFSGLVLADGSLTTLKIFGLQLNASLVTLSACQTGRSVVGAGDELLGLMRAFLYAGTSSLVLSLWAVEDRATAHFMKLFYSKLAVGGHKISALRYAQLQFIHGEVEEFNRHPYFWAPFFLTGDTGPL